MSRFIIGPSDSAGVSPTDVDERGAIRKIPRVKRAQFRKVPLQDRASTKLAPADRPADNNIWHAPVKFLLDSSAVDWREALNLRMLSSNGLKADGKGRARR